MHFHLICFWSLVAHELTNVILSGLSCLLVLFSLFVQLSQRSRIYIYLILQLI